MLTDAQRAYMSIEAALRAGDLKAVRAAFNDPPDFPNVRDPLTWVPVLSLAISWSPLPLVRELLDLGASPNYESDDGFPAVYAALSTERDDKLEVMELLLNRGSDPNHR